MGRSVRSRTERREQRAADRYSSKEYKISKAYRAPGAYKLIGNAGANHTEPMCFPGDEPRRHQEDYDLYKAFQNLSRSLRNLTEHVDTLNNRISETREVRISCNHKETTPWLVVGLYGFYFAKPALQMANKLGNLISDASRGVYNYFHGHGQPQVNNSVAERDVEEQNAIVDNDSTQQRRHTRNQAPIETTTEPTVKQNSSILEQSSNEQAREQLANTIEI